VLAVAATSARWRLVIAVAAEVDHQVSELALALAAAPRSRGSPRSASWAPVIAAAVEGHAPGSARRSGRGRAPGRRAGARDRRGAKVEHEVGDPAPALAAAQRSASWRR
jgi:hypothetical protein